jgi:hypothetical protein
VYLPRDDDVYRARDDDVYRARDDDNDDDGRNVRSRYQ